jgi:hypothetical protein
MTAAIDTAPRTARPRRRRLVLAAVGLLGVVCGFVLNDVIVRIY